MFLCHDFIIKCISWHKLVVGADEMRNTMLLPQNLTRFGA